MKKTFSAAIAATTLLLTAAATVTVTSSADSGPGSLREALADALDGDEVTFAIPPEAPGYDADARAWTITLTGGEIVFEKSLAIQGGGAVILDGNNASRILYCKSKAVLTLCGLAFRNGRAVHSEGKGFGGAVWSRGTLAVTDCAFADNAADKDGGATWAYSNITATGCAFIRNSSREYGGALYTTFGSISATDCTFTGNTARVFGGAVYVQQKAASIALAGCTFTGNRTGEGRAGRGGAVCANSGPVTATDYTFTGNASSSLAGALGAFTTATVTRCVFTANTAGENAGAVSAFDSAIAIDCVFTANTAGLSGAISSGSRTNTAIRCTFKDNTAAGYGGAVSSHALNAADCTFTGNTARNGGGAVSGGAFNATRCTFTANTADVGGAVHTMKRVLTATDCVFTGNAADSGGAICAVAGAVVSVANSVFARNRTAAARSAAIDAAAGVYLYHATVADNAGSGVCISGGDGDDGDTLPVLHAYNSVIAGNSAAIQAGRRGPTITTRDPENTADLTPEEVAALLAVIRVARELLPFTADAVTGASLIEGVTDGATRAAVFGDGAADAGSFFSLLAGGLADKTADALTADGIAVPEGKAAADVIAALRRDITGAARPAEGKVSFGARE